MKNFARIEIDKKLLVLVLDGDFSGRYDTKAPPITLVLHGQYSEKEQG